MSKNKRKIGIVSSNIQSYIDNRKKYLTCNPEYFIHKGSRSKSKAEAEANKHSVSIELVDYNLTKSSSRKSKAKEMKRCIKSLENARDWAEQNYDLPLTYNYIGEIGKLVDSEMNPFGYRRDKVKITGANTVPPSPEKLNRELYTFLWENESLDNSLDKAVHAHFNIARIHPFMDGNGRTARLVQEIILSDNELPLPTIHLFERPEYLEKIKKAAESYTFKEAKFEGPIREMDERLKGFASCADTLTNEELQEAKGLAKRVLSYKITPEQNAFYDFLGLKVLNGLSEALKKLYPSEKEMIRYLKKNKDR